MSLFEHPKYPTIMYISLILVCLLLFFNFVNILESPQEMEARITGFSVRENLNQTQESGEVYTLQSYIIFYVTVISMCALIGIVFLRLNKTIWNNIKIEESHLLLN